MANDDSRIDDLDERFRRALDSILDLVVVERAIRDDGGDDRRFRDRVDEQRPGRRRRPAASRADRPPDLGVVPGRSPAVS